MIRLIAAIDNKRGIARSGQIPWDLPTDKAYFRSQTLKAGGNILMGQTTFSQLEGPMIDRTNYVLSRSPIKISNGVIQVSDLDTFLSNFKEDLWVIGGESIYNQTIDKADELYLTEVDSDFNCDQFFPDYKNFKLKTSDGPHIENGLTFFFKVFERS